MDEVHFYRGHCSSLLLLRAATRFTITQIQSVVFISTEQSAKDETLALHGRVTWVAIYLPEMMPCNYQSDNFEVETFVSGRRSILSIMSNLNTVTLLCAFLIRDALFLLPITRFQPLSPKMVAILQIYSSLVSVVSFVLLFPISYPRLSPLRDNNLSVEWCQIARHASYGAILGD